MEEMIMAVMDRIIELTTRAVGAENAVAALEAKLNEKEQRITELNSELETIKAEYKTTESAWQYKRKQCDELKAENDALTKEVEQLRAKLNSYEGLEAVENANRI